MAASLFEEFEIHHYGPPLFSIGGHTIAFTNSALYMLVAIVCCTLLMVTAMRPQAVVPGRWQMLAEKIYDAVASMIDNAGGEAARPFFPFIFSIFVFVLFCNLFGMLPWSFAVTSHVVINISIAFVLFIIIIITGFVKHGLHFLSLFVPKGLPIILVPPMILIELISFLARPFSLSIRLFANIMAGHVLLQVFAGMVGTLLTAGWLAGISILPMTADIAITGLEFFIAFLQAYIYTILASVYLRDAIEMH